MNRYRLVSLLFALTACGRSGSTAVTGALDGTALQASYAVALYAGINSNITSVDILLSPRADMCALLQQNKFVRNTDVIDIQLYSNITQDMAPQQAGIFPAVQVPNPPSNPPMFSTVVAGITADSNQCLESDYSAAVGGAVTITQLGDTLQPTLGSFDTAFANGRIEGYFFAVPCIIGGGATKDGSVSCSP